MTIKLDFPRNLCRAASQLLRCLFTIAIHWPGLAEDYLILVLSDRRMSIFIGGSMCVKGLLDVGPRHGICHKWRLCKMFLGSGKIVKNNREILPIL